LLPVADSRQVSGLVDLLEKDTELHLPGMESLVPGIDPETLSAGH
jgi:hypothetical protein